MVQAGDIIISYKDMGSVNGQYAVVLDHTLTFPPIITRAYNLESDTGQLMFARFVKANYETIDISILEKLRYLSREGRSTFKESNARAKRQLDHILESMKLHAPESETHKNLQIRLKSVIQPCPDIDDDDDDDYQSDSDADSSEPIVKPYDQSLNTNKTTEITSKPTQSQQQEQQLDVITQKYVPRIPTDSERNTRIMTTAEINALINKQTDN